MSENTLPALPRAEWAQEAARKALLLFGVKSLPVQPERLFARLCGKAVLCPYGQAKSLLHAEDPLNLARTGADARTLYIEEAGLYLTVLRPSPSPERDRFTLAHELGHILLGHLRDFVCTALAKEKAPEEAGVLEKEADLFAAELLAPAVLIFPLLSPRGPLGAEQLGALCGLSREAAKARMGLAKACPSLPDTPELCPELFYSVWEEGPKGIPHRVCASCGARVYENAAVFCPGCGKRLAKGNGSPREGRDTAIRALPRPNRCPAEGRALPAAYAFCPYCGFPALMNRELQREAENRRRAAADTGHEGRFSLFPAAAYLKWLLHQHGKTDAALALEEGRLLADAEGCLLYLGPDGKRARAIAESSREILGFSERVTGKRGVIGIYACSEYQDRDGFPGLSEKEFEEIQKSTAV